jgi:hypothetical protein
MTESMPTPPVGPDLPDPGGPTPPAGPAWGRPDPRVEWLVEYFATHLDAFTLEALAGKAEAGGHPPEVIEAALARLPERLDRPRVESLKRTSRRIVWVIYGLGFLALVAGTASQRYISGLQAPIIVGQLALIAIAAAISLAAIRNRSSAPRGTGAAFASLLAFPLIVFVVFPGLCIYGFVTSRVGQ